MHRTTHAFLATASVAAVLASTAASAAAHVTANPRAQTAGGFTKIDFRVPVEGNGPTTKVVIQFPETVTGVRFQAVPGWTTVAHEAKLSTPAKDEDGGTVSTYTDTLTYTGSVAPGQFVEFPVSMKLPEKGEVGDDVFFPTVQTYANGDVAKWNQKPASADDDPFSLEHPAPFVEMSAGEDGGGHGAMSGTDDDSDAGDDPAKDVDTSELASNSDVDDATRIGWTGIGIGGLALLVALLTLARRPKR